MGTNTSRREKRKCSRTLHGTTVLMVRKRGMLFRGGGYADYRFRNSWHPETHHFLGMWGEGGNGKENCNCLAIGRELGKMCADEKKVPLTKALIPPLHSSHLTPSRRCLGFETRQTRQPPAQGERRTLHKHSTARRQGSSTRKEESERPCHFHGTGKMEANATCKTKGARMVVTTDVMLLGIPTGLR